ncbi:hypothetical protein [Mucilaginibacter sp.]|uniref:hypothetical protein n=1 Tax=Mucilaginibacter sp. TaxID=1882438 RepID=UPI002632F128|nr:hypothetical protein [Mucilaginibacter sp.]MDB4922030.1 hypothetical protein [Mucilaginibacter sp.]
MKVTQILKYRGRELYTLGVKLIFIYAEYSGPTLFTSLMNLCIAKVLESLRANQSTLQLAGKNGFILFKITHVSEIIVRAQNKPGQLMAPDHKIKSLTKGFY